MSAVLKLGALGRLVGSRRTRRELPGRRKTSRFKPIRLEALEDRHMMSGISPLEAPTAILGAMDSYEADNALAQAKVITLNAAAQVHNIHAKGDLDWVKFTLTATSNVVLETSGTSGDTELRLYNSAGSQLAYNNDYNRYFSRISASGLAAGTYYARVNEYGNNATIGAYSLTATGAVAVTGDAYEADNSLSMAKVLTVNAAAQAHSIHVNGDADWVKFTLGATTSVVLATAGSAGDTELTLYNSTGAQLAYNNDYSGTFSRIAANNLTAGTYYAKVNEYGNNAKIASYTLQVTGATAVTADAYEIDNSLAAAKAITVNAAAQAHSIHVNGDADWVKFTLGATTNVAVTTAGSAGDTELTLYSSTGAQLAYNNDYSGTFSRITASNLAAGTYYAKVNEYGNNATIASYTLQVTGASTSSTSYKLFEAWGGTWTDADKSSTNTDDDLLCWAATTSNMLQWTGWGQAGGMTTADAIFGYFQSHWSDQGGHQYYGGDWWFDGTNTMQGVSGWAQVEVAGGGFYTSQNYYNYLHYSSTTSSTLSTIDSYLHAGYGVGLGLSGPSGHAVTCWGYEYAAGSPTTYKGVYITDSDDNQSAPGSDYLKYYSVVQTNGRWYLQNYYGYNSYYISDVTGLGKRPTGVTAKAGVSGALAVASRVAQSRLDEAGDGVETAVQPDAEGQIAALFDNATESNLAVQTDEAVAAVAVAIHRTASVNLQPADYGSLDRWTDSWSDRDHGTTLADAAPTQLRLIASDAVFQAYL